MNEEQLANLVAYLRDRIKDTTGENVSDALLRRVFTSYLDVDPSQATSADIQRVSQSILSVASQGKNWESSKTFNVGGQPYRPSGVAGLLDISAETADEARKNRNIEQGRLQGQELATTGRLTTSNTNNQTGTGGAGADKEAQRNDPQSLTQRYQRATGLPFDDAYQIVQNYLTGSGETALLAAQALQSKGIIDRLAPLQSPGQEAASAASAAASWASARRSDVETAIMQKKQDTIDRMRSGEIKVPEGYAVDADGRLYDTTAASIALGKQKYIEDVRSGKIPLPEGYSIDSDGRLVDTGTYALTKERDRINAETAKETLRLRGVEVGQTGEYQRGQLQQGAERIALDRWIAQQNAAAQAQKNALALSEYETKVSSTPADWIARSWALSGQAPPPNYTPTTQADLINTARERYAAAPTTYTAPTSAPTPYQQAVPAMAYGSDGLNRFAGGSRLDGFVHDRMAVVGDPQRDGGPNPEIIYNPTGAPISVTPMRDLPQGQQEQPRLNTKGSGTNPYQKSADAIAKLLPHVTDTETQHRLVDELATHRKYGYGTMATYANGTSVGISNTGGGGAGGVRLPDPSILPHYDEGTQSYAEQASNANVAMANAGVPSWVPRFNITAPPTPVNNDSSGSTGGGSGTGNTAVGTTVVRRDPRLPVGARLNTEGMSPAQFSRGILGGPNYDYVTKDGDYAYFTDNPAYYGVGMTGWSPTKPAAPTKNAAVSETNALNPVASPVIRQTQEQRVAAAEKLMSPRLRDMFGGIPSYVAPTTRTSNPYEQSGITPIEMPFNLFTPAMIGQLTRSEREALDSYLAAKFNTSLDDAMSAMGQMFGTPGTNIGGTRMRVGRLRI